MKLFVVKICFEKVDVSEKQYICFNKPHKNNN